jgi:beta-lactamase superfamily II metal-dependent hydrolase
MNPPSLGALLLAAAVTPTCTQPIDVAEPAAGRAPLPAASPAASARAAPASAPCGAGRALTAHFYDVGQGLAVLVDLPDGRHVLVDAGDSARRAGCGPACEDASAHLLARLRADLRGAPIDLLWLTHPHLDHVGGAPQVLRAFQVRAYVDNGRDVANAEVRDARSAAVDRGVPIHVVDPTHREVPARGSADITLTPVVPPAWPSSCRHDANECSIGLRVDYCASSLLLTGDAEHAEEQLLDAGGPVTLLQVAHHGSDTSSSPAMLARVRPRYAVISAGKPGAGMNREYCHPRAVVVQRLTRVLGGPGAGRVQAFDGERCERATPDDWVAVPTSDRLWATERDGDVVLSTTGDGVFRRL